MQWLIIGGIFVIFLIAGAVSYHFDQKRKAAIAALAAELGLEHSPDLLPHDVQRFSRFDIANNVSSPKASTAIVAETDTLRMVLFDYQYVVGSGKNKRTVTNAIVMCHDESMAMPEMKFEPESWSGSIAKFFGGQDINFDDDPEFSKTYRLLGLSEESIRVFLTPTRRKKILTTKVERFETKGDTILLFYQRKPLTTESIHKLMNDALTLSLAMQVETA